VERRTSGSRSRNDRRAPETGGEDAVAKLIAFYLPQYHPIPENDRWWGAGFTEWTNVTKASPLFPGHHQPRVPSELGFYDLRLAETRRAQADLARAHGIHAFCYYHYWFGGKQLLERPFADVLASGEPDFPFCLCWANEPWSRRWDGRAEDVLQAQTYSPEDDLAHIRELLPAFADRRYLRIEGKPLFIVYQARDLPDPEATVACWRAEAARAGLPGLYLLTVETGWDAGWDATEVGFDAKVLFQPQFSLLTKTPRLRVGDLDSLQIYDYEKSWPMLADPPPVPYLRFETVFPSWDNSARRGSDAVVVHNSTPEAYGAWLRAAVDRAAGLRAPEPLVFINAWNEWGEGAHLEPDIRHGRSYLEATRRALLPESL
jgi:lipopolysaccharide biosynthesis protein